MPYSHKIHAVFVASLEASTAFDTAYEAVDAETVEKTESYGACVLCGNVMYYSCDYTHKDECPIAIVEKHHDMFQDALVLLDDALAQKLIAAGRKGELREHPLTVMERQMLDKISEE